MNLRITSLIAIVAATLVMAWRLPDTSAPYLRLEHGPRTEEQPAAPAREVMKRARNTRSIPINADLIIRRVAPASPDGPLDLHHQPWDWVEIHNRSERAIPLQGYSLSDDPDHVRKYRFPSIVLPPNAPCRVWLSGFESMGSRWGLTPTDAVDARGWKASRGQNMAHRFSYLWLGYRSPGTETDPGARAYRLQLPVTIDQPGRHAVWLHAGVRDSDSSRLRVLFSGKEFDLELVAREALTYVPLPCPDAPDGYWDLVPGTHTLHCTVVENSTLINAVMVARYDEPFGQGMQDLHAGFKLRQDGEFIGLFDPGGVAVDHVTTPSLPTGTMATRDPRREGTLRIEPVLAQAGIPPPPPPHFDVAPGWVAPGTRIRVTCADPGARIRYTLNGERPNPQSPLLDQDLVVRSNTMLRARAFDAQGRGGAMTEGTFWVEDVSNLPVLSVIAEPSHLYDFSHGILYNTAIRGLLSERRCHMTLIETNGQSTAAVGGMRIQGRSSRETLTKRNFRFVLRERYGQATWPGRLFDGEGPSQCRTVVATGRNIIRRQLAHQLMDIARVRSPRRKPVRLFVNGAPFGLYLLLEDVQDPHYLEGTFGHLDLDVIKEKTFDPVKWGDRELFDQEILPRIDKTGVPITYDELASLMDVDMLCRWVVVVQYAGIDDSGQGYYVRDHRAEQAPWTTINWDFDHAFTIDQGWPLPQGFRSRLLLPVKNASALFQSKHYFPSMQHLANHVLPLVQLPVRTRSLIARYEPFLDEEFDAHLNQRSFRLGIPERETYLQEFYRDRWAQLQFFVDTRLRSLPGPWGAELYGGDPLTVKVENAGQFPELTIDTWPARDGYIGSYYPGTEMTIGWSHPDRARPLAFEIDGAVRHLTEFRTNVTSDLEIRIREPEASPPYSNAQMPST